jgi:hypothetical protein
MAPEEMDTARIHEWLARYRVAWESDSRDGIARLFTSDVRYFTAPYAEPLQGVEAATAYWLEQEESGIPWTFEYEVVARRGLPDGELYVVRAVTRYPEGTRGAAGSEVFHNLWLVTLAGDGRASEFVEYFMLEE